MTINTNRRRCKKCRKPMRRWGKTTTGKQRWQCEKCASTGTRTRRDVAHDRKHRLFLSWCCGKMTVADAAKSAGVTRQTAWRWFTPFWKSPPQAKESIRCRVLVTDGVSVVKHELVALLAGDPKIAEPVGWIFARRENFDAWCAFLLQLRSRGANPDFVVSDGQKGLLKAVREVFPGAVTQRCIVHVHRQAMIWLTRNPKTSAGHELRLIVSTLLLVRTVAQRDIWLKSLRSWENRHSDFLKERTYGENRWWYAHRKLRAVRSLLGNAAPDLFRYVENPSVPRTSNHVEGGLNSRIKELLRSHRGLSKNQRLALVCWYLDSRRKSTRNVT